MGCGCAGSRTRQSPSGSREREVKQVPVKVERQGGPEDKRGDYYFTGPRRAARVEK